MTFEGRAPESTAWAGFTLIELVMVISLLGVLAASMSRYIVGPAGAYLAAQSRAELVAMADVALTRMDREVRLALPNSPRVAASGEALEVLRTLTGGRYRVDTPGDPLDLAAAADTFDVLGGVADPGQIATDPAASEATCISGGSDCLVIYNTGQPGATAYAGDNIAGLRAASATGLEFQRAAPFPFASPQSRFYVVDTPLTFICDLSAGEIRRFAGYPIRAAQADVDSPAELTALGASDALLARDVSACEFGYQPGSATRGGLISMRISLTRDGETVTLLRQVHVGNAP